MKPAMQTILHDPDSGNFGDCFRACVASILEVPVEDIPHFTDKNNKNWFSEFSAWLVKRHGLFPLPVTISDGLVLEWRGLMERARAEVYSIVTLPSPRFHGIDHCVVALNNRVIHDPHPDGMLAQYNRESPWEFIYFLNTNVGDLNDH